MEGRVQGVFFRASTAARARELELSGWARNLSDGRVEVVARGDSQALTRLAEWLWEGPPAARVTGVTVAVANEEPQAGFITR